jgi:putative PIN family toxin of toxin-antitoxin system
MQAVIDTNVLVSAAIKPSGPPGQIVAAMRRGELLPVISRAVFAEYVDVLTRPRFGFPREAISDLLGMIEEIAPMLEPPQISVANLPDPADAPFIALALYARCPVITGNVKHFPAEAGVVVLTPAGWVATLAGG